MMKIRSLVVNRFRKFMPMARLDGVGAGSTSLSAPEGIGWGFAEHWMRMQASHEPMQAAPKPCCRRAACGCAGSVIRPRASVARPCAAPTVSGQDEVLGKHDTGHDDGDLLWVGNTMPKPGIAQGIRQHLRKRLHRVVPQQPADRAHTLHL